MFRTREEKLVKRSLPIINIKGFVIMLLYSNICRVVTQGSELQCGKDCQIFFMTSRITYTFTVKKKTKTSTACFTLMGSSGGNLKTTLKVKINIYDTEL